MNTGTPDYNKSDEEEPIVYDTDNGQGEGDGKTGIKKGAWLIIVALALIAGAFIFNDWTATHLGFDLVEMIKS